MSRFYGRETVVYLPRRRKMWKANTVIKQMCYVYQWSPWKMFETFIWNAIHPTGLSELQGMY
jgi:hypothetical protein